MKKILFILLLIVQVSLAQPPPNSNVGGNGNGNNDPCKNPQNPNCNPVPISGIWILLLIGGAVGIYQFHKNSKLKKEY